MNPWEQVYATTGALPWEQNWQHNSDTRRAFFADRIAAAKAGDQPNMTVEQMERQRALDQGAEDRITLSRNPSMLNEVAAFNRGLPFIGSYTDELAGFVGNLVGRDGDAIAQQVQATAEAYDREHPAANTALGLAGGVTGSIPALALAPAAVGSGPLLSQGIRGGLAGMLGGGVEGAIYGAGQQEGRGRADNAQTGGLIGGILGGGLGAAAPAVTSGIDAGVQWARNAPLRQGAGQLGVSPEATRLLGRVMESEDPAQIAANLQRSGPSAMLADAGPIAQGVLDTTMQAPGVSSRIGRERIDARAAGALGTTNTALDQALGAPVGINTAQANIRQGTAAARSADYDAAYAQPIDYASDAGRRLLDEFSPRIPQSVINDANRLMQINGERSRQIMASIGDDGAVTFTNPPDVRQWDYIKRALDQAASTGDGQGALGGQTPLGRGYKALSNQIRDAVAETVPEYSKALDTAADAITRVNGVRFGASLLRDGTTIEDAADALRGARAPERDAIKQGVRSYIDNTLANVRAVASDQNVDAREAQRTLALLTSRASRDKMRLLLGDQEAGALQSAVNEAAQALGLRASVATNSRTAGRQMTKEFIEDVTEPGMLTRIAQGEPLRAGQAIVQEFTGTTPDAMNARQRAIMGEVTDVLTRSGQPQAQEALRILEMVRNNQPISEEQARMIGQAFTSVAGSALYQQGQRTLGPR